MKYICFILSSLYNTQWSRKESNPTAEATQDAGSLCDFGTGGKCNKTCVYYIQWDEVKSWRGTGMCPCFGWCHQALGTGWWLWKPCHPFGVLPTPQAEVSFFSRSHIIQVPFFPSFFLLFFLPLSYSPVDQLFNIFHPSAELPEVSCSKLNTFLFESTGVPEKFLALQMSSLEFWKCTWISPLCFFFIFIISNLIPLCSRFNLFPTAVPYALTDWNNFKRSELKGPTWNFLRELMWINCL